MIIKKCKVYFSADGCDELFGGYEAYRKKFPKGKDWQDPKPNPYRDGGSGLHPDSYHGMETIGVSIEKYEV